MKKITLILILIASFATQSFASCPIPQWCPSAPLDQNINLGNSITRIDFPTVIAATLVVEWWTDLTRSTPLTTPPPGIIVSGTTSTNDREYQFPVAIYGTPNNAGTYHYTVSNLCGYVALSGTIRVGTPTSIITQPTGTTVCQNTALSLSVAASGTGLTYIWEQSPTTDPNDFSPAPGTNNGTSYTVNTATSGTFYYRVTVAGFTVVESNIVQVIVSGSAPTIGNVTPAVERWTTIGTAFAPLTLTANPTGTPTPTVQWYSNDTASTIGGTNLGSANGAQSNSFTPPNATGNTDGIYYYAVASNMCGADTTGNTSGRHTIIHPIPTCPATTNPTPGNIFCTGNGATFTTIGTPFFKTNTVWTISAGGINQEWSDVVLTNTCGKPGFAGGTTNNFLADCRENRVTGTNETRPTSTNQGGNTANYLGDLFSWCAVVNHATTLCPSPWRVPTCQDFIDLDVALGGTGINRGGADDVRDKLIDVSGTSGVAKQFWGGACVGVCSSTGTLGSQGSYADYWSSSE
ncbi:MAG: fibrobacter succinogenes major paralogous domain-containing protein, partial [Bacteroidales bacterium]|nr:fibrobacter succinogenes major paralogous domain-containing protein [Bacteroidales bacterium]